MVTIVVVQEEASGMDLIDVSIYALGTLSGIIVENGYCVAPDAAHHFDRV